MNNPWKPDPNDNRTPIGPDDISVQRTIKQLHVDLIPLTGKILLTLELVKHAAQQLVAHILPLGHAPADRLGFAQKGFSFHHGRSVAGIGKVGHSGFLHRMNLSRRPLRGDAKNFALEPTGK